MTQPAQLTSDEDTKTAYSIGPWTGGLHNSAGTGESIQDTEAFVLSNLEVDSDGSLVNRPAIRKLTINLGSSATGIRVLGSYQPSDGRQFVVAIVGTTVFLIDSTTGNSVASHGTITSIAVIQYTDKLWVIPVPGGGTGGNFSVATPGATPTWTSVSSVPQGESVVLYQERLWIAAGVDAVSNTSRLYFCDIGDPTSWPGINFVDVQPGNGQKLVYMTVLGNDIVLFKQHSTFRLNYASGGPSKATISVVSSYIGVPGDNCAVTYDNTTVYVLHDSSVYRLFNYTYEKISQNIALSQLADNSLYAGELYGLTLFRNRLFVRYYAHLYAYSVLTDTWSSVDSTRKFSRIVTIPSAGIGLDTAYASTSSSTHPGELYYFQDDRITGVGSDESFNCQVVTKSFDGFYNPYAAAVRPTSYRVYGTTYKVLFWWGLSIATSGQTTANIMLPNTGQNMTWNQLRDKYSTWAAANAAGVTWDQNPDTTISTVVAPGLGGFNRKMLRMNKKLRFRQIYFTISTAAIANNTADASVRIYGLTLYLSDKNHMSKRLT